MKIFLLLSIILLTSSANAREFNIQRDMGECAGEPLQGRQCVTVSYKLQVSKISEVKTSLEAQMADFEQIAKKGKIEVTRQFVSEKIDSSSIDDQQFYVIDGKVTYRTPSAEKAEKFIVSLKQRNYDADTLFRLMASSQCGWN